MAKQNPSSASGPSRPAPSREQALRQHTSDSKQAAKHDADLRKLDDQFNRQAWGNTRD